MLHPLPIARPLTPTPAPETAPPTDFTDVTELADDLVSREQVERLERRYFWARTFCTGRDVHELACGTAQGAAVLAEVARGFAASDNSPAMLERARRHYGDRIAFSRIDAQHPSLPDASVDVLVLFEALYYLRDADAFFREAQRVLRPGGQLLIATANKDLVDFNPSPWSHEYLGTKELGERLGRAGFDVAVFGDTPVSEVSTVQKLLRPVKYVASRFGLIPKSMNAKKLLKRLVFGKLVPMPAEVSFRSGTVPHPRLLPAGVPDHQHKVLLCAATRRA